MCIYECGAKHSEVYGAKKKSLLATRVYATSISFSFISVDNNEHDVYTIFLWVCMEGYGYMGISVFLFLF